MIEPGNNLGSLIPILQKLEDTRDLTYAGVQSVRFEFVRSLHLNLRQCGENVRVLLASYIIHSDIHLGIHMQR